MRSYLNYDLKILRQETLKRYSPLISFQIQNGYDAKNATKFKYRSDRYKFDLINELQMTNCLSKISH